MTSPSVHEIPTAPEGSRTGMLINLQPLRSAATEHNVVAHDLLVYIPSLNENDTSIHIRLVSYYPILAFF